MAGTDLFTKRFDAEPRALWDALKQTLREGEVGRAGALDEGRMQAEFTTGMSLTSWGQKLIAVVEPSERGGTLLRVQGEPRSGFLSTRWGEEAHAAQVERGLLSGVERTLG
jgi:hypothetical protein